MALKPDLTVPVLGLNVDGNPLTRPRGSLQRADNIVLRESGLAQPMRAPRNVVTPGDDSTPRLPDFAPDASTYGVRIFCQGDENVIAIERPGAGDDDAAATKLRTSEDPTNEVSAIAIGTGTWSLSFDNQRTQHAFSDGRHFLTSDSGVVAMDGLDTSSNQALRLAGLMPPVTLTGTADTALTSFYAAGDHVAYIATVRRRVAGKYVIESAPSTPIIVTNAAAFGVSITARLGAYDPIRAGDEVVFYKTKAATSAALIVPVYRQCLVATWNLSTPSAPQAGGYDYVLDADLDGAEVYTSDGQDGPLNPNYMPPLASDVCAFANSLLYVNARSWPTVSLNPSAKFGVFYSGGSVTDRRYGIGARTFSGTWNNATFQFTGVSANDMIGLAVGQLVKKTGATPREITAVSGTTVTLAGTFDVNGVYTAVAYDQATFTFNSLAPVVERMPIYEGVDVLSTATVGASSTYAGLSLRCRLTTIPGVRLLSDTPLGDLSSATKDNISLKLMCTMAGACTSISVTSITNGANYSDLATSGGAYTAESVQDTRQNIVWPSKLQQPEAVSPIANFVVGAEKILRLTKVGQVVLAWCTDGLYQVQGDIANGFVTTQLDPKCVLYHPSAVAVLGNTAYALTYSGIVRAGEGGLQSVSKNAVDSLIQESFGAWPDTWNFAAVADPTHNEVRFSFPSGNTLVFNAQTGQWARRVDNMIHGCFDRGADETGRYTPDVIIATASGYFADGDHCATAALNHNPVAPDSPTVVHQFVDTCLMFEDDLVPEVDITFDGVTSRVATTSATETAHELQCRVPRRAARKPRLTVGFTIVEGSDDIPDWSYSGFGCRYRSSTGKVKR